MGINQTDIESFRQRIKEKRRPYDPVPLRFRLSEKEIAILATNRYQLKCVEITTDLVRFYPYGPLFAHSVGSVRRINERDLANLDQAKYSATKYVGKVGIEKGYESSLHGRMGIQRVETDAHGRVRQVLDREPSKYGSNLDLYLDVSLQASAVRALKQKRGAIVAIDPADPASAFLLTARGSAADADHWHFYPETYHGRHKSPRRQERPRGSRRLWQSELRVRRLRPFICVA